MEDANEYPFVIAYYFKNGTWSVHLYRDKDNKYNVNLSKISAKYNGGGHVCASGFRIAELPWKYIELGK